jgi:hypothetical protein
MGPVKDGMHLTFFFLGLFRNVLLRVPVPWTQWPGQPGLSLSLRAQKRGEDCRTEPPTNMGAADKPGRGR